MTEREQLDQIKKDLEIINGKIRDNCNIIAQLKKDDKALRETVKLLKHKRRELIFSSIERK